MYGVCTGCVRGVYGVPCMYHVTFGRTQYLGAPACPEPSCEQASVAAAQSASPLVIPSTLLALLSGGDVSTHESIQMWAGDRFRLSISISLFFFKKKEKFAGAAWCVHVCMFTHL